jgi:hypothetical protein
MNQQQAFFNVSQDTTKQIGKLYSIIETLRISYISEEYALQRIIAESLEKAHVAFTKEYKLGPRNRIDFFVDGIGIEIKKGKPNRASVQSQLVRYAEFEKIRGIILIVERNVVGIPTEINQKPCYVIGLNRLWGIAI